MAQGQVVKLKLEGEPVFNKGRYIGHRGTGSECGSDEITSSELSQNALAYALESASIGFGIFNSEGTLQEFTEKFHRYLMPAGVTISPNMTMATVMTHIRARNTVKVLQEGKDGHAGEEILVSLRDRSALYLTIAAIETGGFVVKAEMINAIARDMRDAAEETRRLRDENKILHKRVDDYKIRLDKAITQKAPISSLEKDMQGQGSDEAQYLKYLIKFYENQIDVGILVSDMEGKPENANYVAAGILGYRTANDLLGAVNTVPDIKGYDPLWSQVIEKMLEDSSPRFERDIEISTQFGSVMAHEVITIYPSIVNPEKVVSFIYEKSGDSYGDMEQLREEIKAELEEDNGVTADNDFLGSIFGNIRTSVQVIASYSDKDMISLMNSKSQEENLVHIHNSCVEILQRIQDASNLCTVCSDDRQLAQNKFDPETVIHHVCSSINMQVLKQDINLLVELSDHGLEMICDEELLKTSLLRLTQNALSASEANSNITLRIKANFGEKKLSFILSDESDVNIEELLKLGDEEAQGEVNNILFNLKAAKLLLEKMGFSLHITSIAGLGNTVYVTAPEDILVYKKSNSDDIAI